MIWLHIAKPLKLHSMRHSVTRHAARSLEAHFMKSPVAVLAVKHWAFMDFSRMWSAIQ
jgi:hypothetical protein